MTGGFLVSFYKAEFGKGKKRQLTKGLVETSQKTVEESSEEIIMLMIRNKDITISELADKLGFSSRAIEKQIAKLKKEGKIKRVGPDKGGHWEVIEK